MFCARFSAFIACLPGLLFFAASAPLAAQAARPAWVTSPHALHSRDVYIAAVGSGTSRMAAERDALRGIASVFGLDVQSVEQVTMQYREVATDGAATWTMDSGYRSIIEMSVRMENLMGAAIRESWADGMGTHFVLAVLERGRAALLYSDRVRANQDIIRNLTAMPDALRYSFDGFSRYQFAAAFADMSFIYGQILIALGAPWGPLRRGEWYLQRSREILAEIPVGINVSGDREQSIQGAFASALAAFGFRSAGTNPRFVLNVTVNTRRDEHLAPGAEFAWIALSADLVDTSTRAVLLPYSFNERGPGHVTRQGAENFAFNAAVQRIGREYGRELSEFLARLVPGR